MTHRVVITGMAAISSLGKDLNKFWENIKEGKPGFGKIDRFYTSDLLCQCAGMIREYDSPESLGKLRKYLTENTKIFASSCTRALLDAAYNFEDGSGSPLGMIMGSAFGNLEKTLLYMKKNVESGYYGITPSDSFDISLNSAMNNAAIMLKARGIHKLISTGIASGLDAIGNAFHYIRSGRAKIILTGGNDNIFRELFYFLNAERLLAGSDGGTAEIMRPFDENRTGMILGEGSAVLMVEDLDHAAKRNARIYAEITGFGNSYVNNKKKTSPKEWSGDSSFSMVMALKDANLQPDNIDFINASANGSLQGDQIEADSIHRVFCSNKTPVLISSIKGTMGECYGASGAMQCISTVFSINQNIVPPTLNCINPITKIAPYIVMGQKKEQKIMNAMINSTDCYGFNSSLIISKFDQDFSD